jgi:RNA polymerase sigma-70 factor, ECF subfamily
MRTRDCSTSWGHRPNREEGKLRPDVLCSWCTPGGRKPSLFLHLFQALARIPGSMNDATHYFLMGMESETSAIARGLRRRDPDLLDRLIEQYQHRLLRYLVYLVGDRELAEDLFQETWIRVLERGDHYDGKHEFSTWLYAVARNLSIDYLRKKRPASLDRLMEEKGHAPLEPADTRPSAWEIVARNEQAERISAALVGMPAEYRETVVLRFQEGLALEEIATVTRAGLGTVKSRLYRGLNMLMSRLKGAQS